MTLTGTTKEQKERLHQTKMATWCVCVCVVCVCACVQTHVRVYKHMSEREATPDEDGNLVCVSVYDILSIYTHRSKSVRALSSSIVHVHTHER